ncbi:MAG: Alanine racemase, biosynthetic [Alphaproteobacteria bacterium MarineAlpha3_Bin4]|nr:MAG: Alanine racemase, biosynthetic [Alphaproteobacteria bacterium MarineAlpha3_Bin4]
MNGAEINGRHAGAILNVNLDSIQANYRLLLERLGGVPSAAVVKANAYGLGVEHVAPALAEAGCSIFFVTHLEEGVRLRGILTDAEIHVLNGLLASSEEVYPTHRLTPVLNSLGEIEGWRRLCGETPLACDIHVDTGMLRLGLPPDELEAIKDAPSIVAGLNVANVISHLSSADQPNSAQNAEQLARYRRVREILPLGRACFTNSSGIFLSPDYHFDLARPGVALYGVAPVPGEPNPLNPVVELGACILQRREASRGEAVGYGATYRFEKPGLIATLAVGYADGLLRSLSNNGAAYIGGIRVPIVGRVSMDLITIDVSAVAEPASRPGQWVELIGPNNTVDDVARAAGTIGYEILTNLGTRYHRAYTGGGD